MRLLAVQHRRFYPETLYRSFSGKHYYDCHQNGYRTGYSPQVWLQGWCYDSQHHVPFRKITITFNLPKGITASNPEGGEVVEAVASGGAFEFKLIVDKNYFQTLDSIEVTANGTVITPDIYGIYTLSNQTSDVTVNVSGISGVTHLITLVQSANGVIVFTGDEDAENSRTVNHGDPVR